MKIKLVNVETKHNKMKIYENDCYLGEFEIIDSRISDECEGKKIEYSFEEKKEYIRVIGIDKDDKNKHILMDFLLKRMQ
ncbi:hypothetical protein [Cetobacterium sp.]|uniref:hypothetical protein n=1 Tax=Cetobacterium sp. TaxID=2071632 RepID=UPI003EE7FBFE